ncbi:hypothetical protein [Staphylothermus hellenicus]|uniref:DUF1634 domain-containing protein n=1 Tax=Staphylothermus hellenicus (strain DSM 12710 / JCM 10830 / BK20S6-10-b1 / P8) TaxID=591019 RepID=D7DBH9_STAHD|nr:hypothetical protein [Staphylothermus hellenicus]ADI31526.1 hypothetical protein Shell_0394 [Staphylothermus hellenicus DSM 12710]
MLEKTAKILRYGVFLGLAILLVGLFINNLLHIDLLVYIGLITIVVTPMITLFSISIMLLLRKDYRSFTLSIILLLVLIISIIVAFLE